MKLLKLDDFNGTHFINADRIDSFKKSKNLDVLYIKIRPDTLNGYEGNLLAFSGTEKTLDKLIGYLTSEESHPGFTFDLGRTIRYSGFCTIKEQIEAALRENGFEFDEREADARINVKIGRSTRIIRVPDYTTPLAVERLISRLNSMRSLAMRCK